jgi:hypothetical protein
MHPPRRVAVSGGYKKDKDVTPVEFFSLEADPNFSKHRFANAPIDAVLHGTGIGSDTEFSKHRSAAVVLSSRSSQFEFISVRSVDG